MIKELFKYDIEGKEISLEIVKEKSNCFPYATPKQVSDKVQTIIGGKRSQIPVSAHIYFVQFFLFNSFLFFFLNNRFSGKANLIFNEVIVTNINVTLLTEEMVIRGNQNDKI